MSTAVAKARQAKTISAMQRRGGQRKCAMWAAVSGEGGPFMTRYARPQHHRTATTYPPASIHARCNDSPGIRRQNNTTAQAMMVGNAVHRVRNATVPGSPGCSALATTAPSMSWQATSRRSSRVIAGTLFLPGVAWAKRLAAIPASVATLETTACYLGREEPTSDAGPTPTSRG